MKKFRMEIVGDCRGYFFKGVYEWEDENLVRGLGRIRIMGNEIEEDDYEMGIGKEWGWREDMSVKEVVDWVNSDCIGGGEEMYCESVKEVVDWVNSDCIGGGEEMYCVVEVNGEVVYENKVDKWMYDNLDDDDYGYEDKLVEEFGEEWYDVEMEEMKNWNFEKLEKMK